MARVLLSGRHRQPTIGGNRVGLSSGTLCYPSSAERVRWHQQAPSRASEIGAHPQPEFEVTQANADALVAGNPFFGELT